MDLNRLQAYLHSSIIPPDERYGFTEEQNQINTLLNKWLAKITRLGVDKAALIQLFKERGFTSEQELIEYIEKSVQKIKDDNREKENQLIDKQKDDKQISDEKKQDDAHNDLFELTMNNNGNFKLQDKDLLLIDKRNRQRNVFDRNLKLLEALEEIRKISRQTNGILEINLEHLKKLDPKVFETQMDLLSRFGIRAMSVATLGLDSQVREITTETVTKEQIEKGEVVFGIPFRELQSEKWGEKADAFRKQMEDYLNRKGIEPEKLEPLKVEDDVINAIAGTDRSTQSSQRKVEDNEAYR